MSESVKDLLNDGTEVPVLLIRTGSDEFAAVTAGEPGAGWNRLPQSVMAGLAPLLRGAHDKAPSTASARYFTARARDLGVWDNALRHGPGDGYMYGTAWGKNGQITKNVAFKEIARPAGVSAQATPIDPLALATAVGVAQIQASIERLTSLVERVAQDVKAIETFLLLEQQGAVLAAVETIDGVYARYIADSKCGTLDWERVAHLENLLKQQHRQILGELHEGANVLTFRTIGAAKKSMAIQPSRVGNLITLEFYLLRALARWTALMLAAKQDRGEQSLGEVRGANRLVDSYCRDAAKAVKAIHQAHSTVPGRNLWDRLWSDGLVMGEIHDNDTRDAALGNRAAIREVTKAHRPIALGPAQFLKLVPSAAGPTVPKTQPA